MSTVIPIILINICFYLSFSISSELSPLFSCPNPFEINTDEHTEINKIIANLNHLLGLPQSSTIYLLEGAGFFSLEGGLLKVSSEIDRENLCISEELIQCCVNGKPPRDDNCLITLKLQIVTTGNSVSRVPSLCQLRVFINDR